MATVLQPIVNELNTVLVQLRTELRGLQTDADGAGIAIRAASQLVPPENEISACASREPSPTSTRTMFPCYPSLIVRSLLLSVASLEAIVRREHWTARQKLGHSV